MNDERKMPTFSFEIHGKYRTFVYLDDVEFIEAENTVLQKQLDIAKEALKYYSDLGSFDRTEVIKGQTASRALEKLK